MSQQSGGRINTCAACIAGLLVFAQGCTSEEPVERVPVQDEFLTVSYKDFRRVEQPDGFDLVYVAPGTFERLGDYQGIMVDQPEVWIDEASSYPGAKPDDLKALADLARDTLIGELIRGGYDIVEVAGPGVVYFRIALTDLNLVKRERRPTNYVPVSGASANERLRQMFAEIDIVEMSIQAELLDSATEEVLGALVIHRGGDDSGSDRSVPMDLPAFRATIAKYGARIRCRFDNGRLDKSQWVDCSRIATASQSLD